MTASGAHMSHSSPPPLFNILKESIIVSPHFEACLSLKCGWRQEGRLMADYLCRKQAQWQTIITETCLQKGVKCLPASHTLTLHSQGVSS